MHFYIVIAYMPLSYIGFVFAEHITGATLLVCSVSVAVAGVPGGLVGSPRAY